MSDETTPLPCPFCGGEAGVYLSGYGEAGGDYVIQCGCCAALSDGYDTEAEAIAAWDTRAPVEHDGWFYLPKPKENIVQHGDSRIEKTETGYKTTQHVEVIESAIRSWGDELGEYVMKRICEVWNVDAAHGTLTAEQVREAIEKRFGFGVWVPAELWQAIADELNATLGSEL